MLFAIFVSEGQDEQALEGSFRDGMERLAGARLGEPATAQTMLGGLDCKHLQWKADDVRVDAFFLARDRTFFGLCAVDEDGTLGTEKAKLSLQLLE